MTHIRGEIEKIYEVLKTGYKEPLVQTTKGYTITTGAIAPGVHVYDLPAITIGTTGYVKKISATCNDATSIHNVYLTRSDPWVFFTSFFYIGYEWDTGDTRIYDYLSWTVTITNNAAGNVNFTINVYWIES